MKTSRHFPLTFLALAALLLAPALRAQDVLIQPTAITSATSATDFFPAGNLINGSGLSGTPTLGSLGTHSPSDASTSWVTQANGADYFASNPPPVVLTCTLPQAALVSELVLWGYGGNANEAKAFTVEFSTDGTNFGSAASVTQSTLLGTAATRLAFPGGARAATHVRLTITDNHFGAGVGGDRVGLGEIRFAGQPGVIVRNLANASTNQGLSFEGQFAQAFDPGPVPAALKAITVRLAHSSGTSRARVQLWSSPPAGTVPVTLVEDLGPGVDFTNTADVDYTFPSAALPVMAANSRYWVVVLSDFGSFLWRNSSNSAFVSATGATLPLARARGVGAGPTWEVFSGSNYQLMSVTAGLTVTNPNDSGTGSLRHALAAAAVLPGADVITFAPALSGQTISLNGVADAVNGASALTVNDSAGVTLDADDLIAQS